MGKLFSILIQMYVDPARGFRNALSGPARSALFPLAMVIVGTTALNAFYYSHVDLGWLADVLTIGLNAAQKRVVVAALTPGRLLLISFVSVLVLPAAMDAARAAFFWVALRTIGRSADYRSLFLITAWSAMPLLLVLPAGILSLVLGDAAHTAPNNLNPVSLNRLFFHLDTTSHWSVYFTTLTLVGFWEVALNAVGLKVRTDMSTRGAVTLALAPLVIVYGIWGIVVLLKFGTTG